MSEPSGATLIATGMLPFVVLVSAAVTAPVSMALLALYRRAVLRSMAEGGEARPDARPEAPATVLPPPAVQLQLDIVAGLVPKAPSPAQAQAARSLRRAVAVQLASGIAYAAVLAAAWMVFTLDSGVPLMRFLWLLVCHAWPTVLGITLIAAAARRQRLQIAGVYFALLLALAIVALARNPELTAAQAAAFWLLTNAPPTLLLLAFLRRRVRAVGPLVLAFMVAAVTGSQVTVSLVGQSEAAMRTAVATGSLLGLGGTGTFFALMLGGMLLAAFAGWQWLQWLGRRHLARRTSDQALTLDAMWLLFGVVHSIGLAFEGLLWTFTGLVAFAACKLVTHIGQRVATPGPDPAQAQDEAPSLLLLRVFALGARSERLFDALNTRWLRAGDISLIAGPDLATTTVEPREFLDFVGGRLSRQFVRDEPDLQRRLKERALGPDPDGRYRVNEFFCHADTWQPAMRRLAAGADAVLMDLRSFSPANQGCQYELQQLLDAVPLARVVCLIDATTDRAFLEATLRRLWQSVAADSPNRTLSSARLRLLAVDASREFEVGPLLALLHTAAARTG